MEPTQTSPRSDFLFKIGGSALAVVLVVGFFVLVSLDSWGALALWVVDLVALVFLAHALAYWSFRRRRAELKRQLRRGSWMENFPEYWNAKFGDYFNTPIGCDWWRYELWCQKACDWLREVVWKRHSQASADEIPTPLLRYRQDFRELICLQPTAGLISCLSTDDHELLKLVIWLLGHSGTGQSEVRNFCSNPDWKVRWHVAKALRRMSEWTDLQYMANNDNDPRVRRLATMTRRPYFDRLSRFVQHGGGEVFEPDRYSSHMPMFMLQPVGPGKPPKSRDWIRRILEHIRQLVGISSRNRAA